MVYRSEKSKTTPVRSTRPRQEKYYDLKYNDSFCRALYKPKKDFYKKKENIIDFFTPKTSEENNDNVVLTEHLNGEYLSMPAPQKMLEYYGENIENHDCIIAGGIFKNLLKCETIKDYDLFYKNEEDFKKSVEFFEQDKKVEKIYDTENSVGFATKEQKIIHPYSDVPPKINYDLVRKFFDKPLNIIDNFDFTITKICMYKNNENNKIELLFHKNFVNDLIQKNITYNNKVEIKTGTIERVERYVNYGYQISYSDYKETLEAFCKYHEEELKEYDTNIDHIMSNILETGEQTKYNINDLTKQPETIVNPIAKRFQKRAHNTQEELIINHEDKNSPSYLSRYDQETRHLRTIKLYSKYSDKEYGNNTLETKCRKQLSKIKYFEKVPQGAEIFNHIKPTLPVLEFLQYIEKYYKKVPEDKLYGIVNIVISTVGFVAPQHNHQLSNDFDRFFHERAETINQYNKNFIENDNMEWKWSGEGVKLVVCNTAEITQKILQKEETTEWFNKVEEYYNELYNDPTFKYNFTYEEHIELLNNNEYDLDIAQPLLYNIYVSEEK